MKQFWKSSEFWMTLGVILAPVVDVPVNELSAFVVGAYAIGRSIYKAFWSS